MASLISVWGVVTARVVTETPVFISQGTFSPAGQVSFEVRDYAPSVAAETCLQDSSAAFHILAEYYGVSSVPANDRVETIAMTAPVVTYQQNDQDCMQFILPGSVYGGDVTTAPAPTNDDVTLISRPQMLLAVMTFNGRPSAEDYTAYLKDLKLAVQQMEGESSFQWSIKIPEHTEIYEYNQPSTPGPWRTNEVVIELVQKN